MDCTAIPPTPDRPGASAPRIEEDWSALISELTDVHDMSQREIAAYCHCGQTTISDLYCGDTKDPRHRIGEALRRLRASKRSEATAKGMTAPAPGGGASAGVAAIGG